MIYKLLKYVSMFNFFLTSPREQVHACQCGSGNLLSLKVLKLFKLSRISFD